MSREDEDFEIIRRCRGGSIDEFRGIVEKYEGRVYRLIAGIVLDHELARDLTQETFIKAFRSLDGFKGDASFFTWLYRIAFNLALDAKKRRSADASVSYDDSWIPSPAPGFGNRPDSRPDRAVLGEELHEMILKGMAELTPVQRTVLVLREWDGYSYREISKIMRTSRGTVMSRLHYARNKLRQNLKGYLSGR